MRLPLIYQAVKTNIFIESEMGWGGARCERGCVRSGRLEECNKEERDAGKIYTYVLRGPFRLGRERVIIGQHET